MQWQDNKTVSLISSMHKNVNRRTKVNGAIRRGQVRQPGIVKDYNSYMSGVGKSDQLIDLRGPHIVSKETDLRGPQYGKRRN